MRICVIGCGAVGGLFAAHLATLPDVEVWGYDVMEDHVAAINARGLRLTGAAELVAHVRARSDPGEIPPCELGIVATKAMATEAAIAASARVFTDAAVCSVQNGIGNEEVIAAHVARVIRGTTLPAGHLVGPGVVAMDTGGETAIGPFEDRPARAAEIERLADAMTRAGLPARALADARGAQWTKVIFNAASNPVGALTGLSHGRVCELPALRALVSGLAAEGVAVAAALGIALDADPERVIDHAATVAYDHRASMLQDVLARRPTEVDVLNGAIVRLGARHGVPTPLNEAIVGLIEGVERSWRGQPRRLRPGVRHHVPRTDPGHSEPDTEAAMETVYTTTAVSTGDGRNGTGALADHTLEFSFASPKETGGSGNGANPEQLFALGYAACFHSALKVVGGRLGKSVAGSTVAAEVSLGRDAGGFGLAVKLTAQIPQVSAAEARELIEAAHEICPYSKATRGNISVELAVK